MDSTKRTAELLLPGSSIGVIAAAVVAAVALVGGLPGGYVAVAATAIGGPLALFGAGYGLLLAKNRIRLGGITPAVGYWLVGYTASRVIHEVALDAYAGRPIEFSGGLLSFLVFQALVSVGFAVGFIWLHEHTAPLWWIRVRDRNPVAASYVAAYAEQAARTKQRPGQRGAQGVGQHGAEGMEPRAQRRTKHRAARPGS